MKTKCKFLGTYHLSQQTDPDFPELQLIEHESNPETTYLLDNFVRSNSIWGDSNSIFHAIASSTNTSSIGLKILDDETFRLWLIY